MTSTYLWNEFKLSFLTRDLKQSDLIYSIRQDKSASISCLVIKNNLDEIVGQVEFILGAREYKILIADEIFKIVINLTWGGRNLSLISPNGLELVRLERKSFNLLKHTVTVSGLGILTSTQPLFNLKQPIEYSLNNNLVAFTCLISKTRNVGRIGCFSKDVSLPVKIFILSMTL